MTQKKTWRISSGSCVLAAALRVDVFISSRHAFNPICVTTMNVWVGGVVGGGMRMKLKMQVDRLLQAHRLDRLYIGLQQQQRQREKLRPKLRTHPSS